MALVRPVIVQLAGLPACPLSRVSRKTIATPVGQWASRARSALARCRRSRGSRARVTDECIGRSIALQDPFDFDPFVFGLFVLRLLASSLLAME